MRRIALLAVLSLLAAPPAFAGPPPAGQYVDLEPVGLPIVDHGVLVNYIFVYVRLNLTPLADVGRVREKEPFFRDSLVRDAHRTPFVLPSDPNHIDQAKLSASVMREAQTIVGPGVVTSVVVTSEQSQKRIPIPRT
jgi:hypothetical protein